MPPEPSKNHHVDLLDGRFKRTSPQDLKNAISSWRASDRADHIVLHFHGGLVSRRGAHTMVEGLQPYYEQGDAWPLFVVWNSDLLSTLRGNLDEIGKEKIFRRLLRKLAQAMVGKLAEGAGGRGGALELPPMRQVPEEPEALEAFLLPQEPAGSLDDAAVTLSKLQLEQIEKELSQDVVIREESEKIANWSLTQSQRDALAGSRGAGSLTTTPTRMSQSVLDELRKEAPEPGERGIGTLVAIAKHAVKIAIAVFKRYRKGRAHGLYTTIVEETLRRLYLDDVGALVWKMMKKDTRDAFGSDGAVHGGTALIQQLLPHLEAGARLTLVGHSTGAIYIAHFLRELDKVLSSDKKADVVFLAPACTFDLLHDNLEVLKARVRGLRMFALEDGIERGYWEVPVLYKGSLLYMVSGLFEDEEVDMPIVGMQRYYDATDGPYDRPDCKAISQWITPAQRIWSEVDQGDGKRSSAHKHGAFDDNTETRESLRHILKHGMD